MKILENIVDKFKLTQILWIIFLITCFMTFLDNSILKTMGIYEIKNEYHKWIGITLTSSSVGLIVIYGEKIFKFFNYKYKLSSIRGLGAKAIKNLNRDESSALIRYFYNRNEKCFVMEGRIPLEDGMGAVLRGKGLISISSQLTTSDEHYNICASHILQPFAYDFLNKNISSGDIKIDEGRYMWNPK